MSDPLEDFMQRQKPTAARPLQGNTVLVVEDSRFASEAVRLICLRSGARVRRADSMASAARHLATYRPTVAIVDPGLPDGCGIELIRELRSATPPVPVVLAISGDPGAEARAKAAGAQAFLTKPLTGIAVFQQAVLDNLPQDHGSFGLRPVSGETIAPDRLAFLDDVAHVSEALASLTDPAEARYLAQFLSSLARIAGDANLHEAAEHLACIVPGNAEAGAGLARVREMLDSYEDKSAIV